MGIKFDEKTKKYTVSVHKRHPITRVPKTIVRKNIETEEIALKLLASLSNEVDKHFEESLCPTWPNFASRYIEQKSLGDWAPQTAANARISLEAHTFGYWKNRRVDSISSGDIRKLLSERLGHRSPTTQASILKYLRGVFQSAVEEGLIGCSPVPKMRVRQTQKIAKVLTAEQAKILLEKAKEFESPWYYHWALALYTGMRNGELYALTWSNVDIESRRILVNASWSKVGGMKDTKSGDDRIVEIAPNLCGILQELKLQTYDSAFVLPRSRDWEKGEQARMLRMFLQGIGLPTVRFHDLRSVWCCLMLSNGVEPIKVMSMGGWTQLKTMQIYIRKAGVNIKGITNGLDLHDHWKQPGQVLQMQNRSDV